MKRSVLVILCALLGSASLSAQGVAINTTGNAADTSAALDVSSMSKGMLTPRLTVAQRAAIILPATGLLVYQTDGWPGFYYNAGSALAPFWTRVSDSVSTTSANPWTTVGSNIFYNAGRVGIGTSTPATTLDVAGDARLRSNDFWKTLTVSGQSSSVVSLSPWNYLLAARLHVEGPVGLAFVGTTSNHPFSIRANNTDQIVANTNGTVTIPGTLSAGSVNVANSLGVTGSFTASNSASVNGSLSVGISLAVAGNITHGPATLTLPSISTMLVGTTTTDLLYGKTLVDNATFLANGADNTKKIQFMLSGLTTGITRSLTVPDASTTLVGTDVTQTLTNKTLDNPTITGNISMPLTTGSTAGVILKGGNRFIHDYQASGTNGYNTFVGLGAGNFAMSGSGVQASANTGVGNSALYSITTGNDNSAFGAYALTMTTTGVYNSAFGSLSLYANTAGGNSAFGASSLSNNATGFNNSAFGYQSLYNNVIGSYNSAFGYQSLLASTGSNNTAIGYFALNSTTGGNNTALGFGAGGNLTTGSNNICLGYNSAASSSTVSNEITLGNSGITALRCQVTSITSLSDARDKTNIRDLPYGLEFLMKLRPRLFNWDRRDWYEDGKPDGSKMKSTPTAGFIAQEFDEVQTKEHVEWLDLVLKSNPDRLEATPGNLLPILVKAIQDLKNELSQSVAQVQRQRETILRLQAVVDDRTSALQKAIARYTSLEKRMQRIESVLTASLIEDHNRITNVSLNANGSSK